MITNSCKHLNDKYTHPLTPRHALNIVYSGYFAPGFPLVH